MSDLAASAFCSPFLSLHRALRAIENGDTLSFNNGTYDAVNESYNKVFSFRSNPGQDSVLINFNGSWVLHDSTGKDVNFIDIKTQNIRMLKLGCKIKTPDKQILRLTLT